MPDSFYTEEPSYDGAASPRYEPQHPPQHDDADLAWSMGEEDEEDMVARDLDPDMVAQGMPMNMEPSGFFAGAIDPKGRGWRGYVGGGGACGAPPAFSPSSPMSPSYCPMSPMYTVASPPPLEPELRPTGPVPDDTGYDPDRADAAEDAAATDVVYDPTSPDYNGYSPTRPEGDDDGGDAMETNGCEYDPASPAFNDEGDHGDQGVYV